MFDGGPQCSNGVVVDEDDDDDDSRRLDPLTGCECAAIALGGKGVGKRGDLQKDRKEALEPVWGGGTIEVGRNPD